MRFFHLVAWRVKRTGDGFVILARLALNLRAPQYAERV
jgi:hypothetical protein